MSDATRQPALAVQGAAFQRPKFQYVGSSDHRFHRNAYPPSTRAQRQARTISAPMLRHRPSFVQNEGYHPRYPPPYPKPEWCVQALRDRAAPHLAGRQPAANPDNLLPGCAPLKAPAHRLSLDRKYPHASGLPQCPLKPPNHNSAAPAQ